MFPLLGLFASHGLDGLASSSIACGTQHGDQTVLFVKQHQAPQLSKLQSHSSNRARPPPGWKHVPSSFGTATTWAHGVLENVGQYLSMLPSF